MKKKNFFKIGIDARMYGSRQTGIGNYVKNLIDNLSKIDSKNSYIVFLLAPGYEEFKIPNERWRKVMVNSYWYGWKEQIIFPWQLAREKLNLIHFPHFNSPILYLGRSIITIHDIIPKFFPGHRMNRGFHKKAYELTFSFGVRKAAKVIAVSENTKNDILKYHRVNPEKIEVIYEGVIPRFQAVENYDKIEKIKQKYGLKKPFVFYTGVWRAHKNLVNLIKAFDLLLKKYCLDCRLVLGGEEDPHYPEVRRTWEDLGLEKEIIRTGFISDEELPLFYQAADIFVIPSFYEGFGLVGLEAMASGTPVVASRITSLPEVLGEAALFFNPANYKELAYKMSQVLTDKNLKKELVEKGTSWVKRYSWCSMAKKTLCLYEEILNF